MAKWIKQPAPGQIRGEGEWKTIEDAGVSEEEWFYLSDSMGGAYLPVCEQDEKPTD